MTMPAPPITRSKVHYVEDNLVIFRVENKLFRVSNKLLIKYTLFFADLFTLPQEAGSAEGGSDDNPIVIKDVPVGEFEALLDMVATFHYGFRLDDATASQWMMRLAAAIRWDAPDFRACAMKHLARSKDHCVQLVAAMRFGLPNWKWPAIFGLCLRDDPLSLDEVQALSPYPKALHTVITIREAFKSDRATLDSVIKRETRVRNLMYDIFQLEEPFSSDIPPPLSGYRIHVRPGQQMPAQIPTSNPFTDLDGSPIYVGSSGTTCTKDIVPGKVRFSSRVFNYPWGGGKEPREHQCDSDFSILNVDINHMEWIKTSGGRIPTGRTPVLGGYEALVRGPIFHAYAEHRGVSVPGKTSEAFGCAILSFGGSEHHIRDDYYILVHK